MILTSHRLDCLRLCLDMLLAADSARHFDTIVFLENGVTGRHLRFIDAFIREHPEIRWDRVRGPRGRGERISVLENECVRRYPDALYFKIDEDTFVAPGWVDRLVAAYELHRDDPNLSLITPVIPNNSAGAYFLLHAMPELGTEYDRRFGQPRTPYVNGPVATYPQIGEWLTRRFLDLRQANVELVGQCGTLAKNWADRPRGGAPIDPDAGDDLTYEGSPPHLRFAFRFSINCICYDYRHWTEIGGVPVPDEIGWGDWIRKNNKYIVLATDLLVHHYSFFVQQDWLDRTHLLEDLRMSNVPASLPRKTFTSYGLPRWQRLLAQAPRVIRRRLDGSA